MNRFKKSLLALMGAACLALLMTTAWAGEGHDHGAAPAAAAGQALPRFAAVSDLFELVGVVNGKQITLYLDHFADGSPVKDAKLELELGGIKVPVESHSEGEFEATLAQELKPGVIAVAATVMAGAESDLLAGELDLHGETAVAEAHRHDWKEYLTWSVAGLAGLALLIAIARRLRASRPNMTGGAA
ncbi:MAG: hypothetical protein OHM77_00815 [Candidatus Nitricoxidivorans perseverans]|uniref:Transmembrane protein n=1 Tax=Candidatus Nitricoxidivorans perseverans TaxID=2975601 RepID=A0AA49IYA9_9PROT|nr:MAG: hypothetical protein OHM77_00815 [Candidatus Nitricoxidivorans perseverans]